MVVKKALQQAEKVLVRAQADMLYPHIAHTDLSFERIHLVSHHLCDTWQVRNGGMERR